MRTRTVRIPLTLTEAELGLVLDTMRLTSQVYARHVDYILANKTLSKSKLHEGLYTKLRAEFKTVPSALLQATRDAASENIKTINTNHPTKKWSIRPVKTVTSGIRLDGRTFTIRGNQLTFSTVGKRIKTIIAVPAWFAERYANYSQSKSATISYDKKNKRAYLNLVYQNTEEITPVTTGKTVGIDRGLYSLFSTSEGGDYRAQILRKTRRKYLHLRKTLQQKGTRSAKKKLKKLSGKEKRFMTDVNHQVTKQLANDSTVSTYVLEDLKGIRAKRKGKKMNTWLGQWTFFQFETLLKYKCAEKGKTVAFVDPRYTSQKCSQCKRIDKTNRKKNYYTCKSCGYHGNADHNAAINIRDNYILSIPVGGAGSQSMSQTNRTQVQVQAPTLAVAGN